MFTGLGSIVAILGCIGLLRLPDFYTRVHAQTVIIIGGTILVLFGFILQAGLSQYSLKTLLIIIITLITAPTSSHAIARAAFKSGKKPWKRGERRK